MLLVTVAAHLAPAIPVNDLKRHNALLLGQLADSVTAVLNSGWYILGPKLREFEAAFARFCGVEHCIGTANGTDSLELALRACGVGPGHQVATVANAGGYSTTAIRAAGAEPIYVDVEPGSMLLDIGHLQTNITPRTRAVIATHLYGRMVDMPRLMDIASRAEIAVIEDCAQAHGARLCGRHAGAWGALGCFSFYPTKNLGALGDGGAIITNDAALAGRTRDLRQYGWKAKYRSGLPGGRNSRLDEIQAAVLLAKLPHLEQWNARRRDIARTYSEGFAGLNLRSPDVLGPECVAHLYVIRVPNREALQSGLSALGIGTDIHYPVPDHSQDCYRTESWAACILPVTEQCCTQVLTLPCFPELTDEEVNRIVLAVRQALREA